MSGSDALPVNSTENGADPVLDGLTEKSLHSGTWLAVVVGAVVGDTVGAVVTDGETLGETDGETEGEGPLPSGQAFVVIVTFDGATVDNTSSVGSSAGAREKTRDLSESNCTIADPAAFGRNVIVATLLILCTARVTSAPTDTEAFASPLVILGGLTTVGNSVLSLICKISSFEGSYVI